MRTPHHRRKAERIEQYAIGEGIGEDLGKVRQRPCRVGVARACAAYAQPHHDGDERDDHDARDHDGTQEEPRPNIAFGSEAEWPLQNDTTC